MSATPTDPKLPQSPRRLGFIHLAQFQPLGLRSRLRPLAAKLRLEHWFPHVPLALAIAWAGYQALRLAYNLRLQELTRHFPQALVTIRPAGMPFLLLGVALLFLSAGLGLRSRLVWSLAILLVSATMVANRLLPHVAIAWLSTYLLGLLVALILARRSFSRSSVAAGTLFAVTSSLLLLMYAVFGSLYFGAQFKPPILDLGTAFYYAVITMGTVGYGDIVPGTLHARLFTVSIVVLGIAVFATSLSAIVAPLVTGSINRIVNRKEGSMTRSDHFIIVGLTPLAYNTYRELKSRHQQVTLIAPQAPPEGDFTPEDVIVGDASNVETLRRAHASAARAVLALRADDSENAFIVLSVKELKGKAKTVVAVNDSKHMERVKLVQPDIIIAPQVLGGEILAMALSGENISGEFMLERFLNIRPQTQGTES